MFTSAIQTNNKIRVHLNRTIATYSLTSVLVLTFNQVYQLFGHGQTSQVMETAFLYPLLITLCFLFIKQSKLLKNMNRSVYRIAYNLIGSGIATLTVASLIKGIFEIAGTNSNLLVWMFALGGVMTVAGFLCLPKALK